MPSRFYEQDVNARLKNKRNLSSFLDALVWKHLQTEKIQLTYIFCTDERLLEINQQFLNHDTLTDIITFDLSTSKNELTGEIYISVPRIKENAEKYNCTYNEELHRVIFHGALHLCGYKDKNAADQANMRSMENNCLEEYFKPIA